MKSPFLCASNRVKFITMINVIVGKNPLGAMVASALQTKELKWVGVEENRADSVATVNPTAGLLMFSKITLDILLRFFPTLSPRNAVPPEKTSDLPSSVDSPSDGEPEGTPSFVKCWTLDEWPAITASLMQSVGEKFSTMPPIARVSEEGLHFVDDTLLAADCVYWCQSAQRLNEVLKKSVGASTKLKLLPDELPGAIEITRGPFSTEPTADAALMYSFRFKDERICGSRYSQRIPDPVKTYVHRFESFVATQPVDCNSDAELLAKFVRAFRREIDKQMVNERKAGDGERIIHHRISPLVRPPEVTTNRLMPNLFFCGQEVSLETTPATARSFEFAVHNAHSALVANCVW